MRSIQTTCHPYRKAFMVLTLLCLGAISCKKKADSPVNYTAKAIDLPAGGPAIISSEQQFAFDFFHAALQADNGSGNKLVSPLSIYAALGMAANGADNATLTAMLTALRTGAASIDDLSQTCKALLQQLPAADPHVTLDMANSVWYRSGMTPLTDFSNIVTGDYQASAQPVNFGDPGTVNTINNWVSTHTQGKIPNVLSSVNTDDLIYLINALYFKGDWKYQFLPSATTSGNFYKPDNSVVTASFMTNNKVALLHFGSDSLQMVQLPYGGGNCVMDILLPGSKTTISSLAASLNAASFRHWISQADSASINLQLPRFSFHYSIDDMSSELGQMGMSIAFNQDQADFSRLFGKSVPAYISRAIHKTFIDTDETGTTASAATAIGVATTVSTINQPLLLKFDHPFIIAIRETTSGAILFTGIVNDPTAN